MSFRWWLLTILIAMAGGIFAVIGAFIEEVLYAAALGPFIAGPIIEESLKPAGVYLLLAKWQDKLRSQLHIAILSSLGGLVFAVIENILYLKVYIDEPTHDIIVIRWTAGIILHMLCSFIAGFGINQRLLASIRGEIPFLSGNKKFFVIAIVIHSLYNITAVIIWSIMG